MSRDAAAGGSELFPAPTTRPALTAVSTALEADAAAAMAIDHAALVGRVRVGWLGC